MLIACTPCSRRDIYSDPCKTVEIEIYRKHITTETTIDFISNHPMEHKAAACKYRLNP